MTQPPNKPAHPVSRPPEVRPTPKPEQPGHVEKVKRRRMKGKWKKGEK